MMLATLVQLAGPHKAFLSNKVGPELRIGGHQFGQSSPDELSTAVHCNRSAQLLQRLKSMQDFKVRPTINFFVGCFSINVLLSKHHPFG